MDFIDKALHFYKISQDRIHEKILTYAKLTLELIREIKNESSNTEISALLIFLTSLFLENSPENHFKAKNLKECSQSERTVLKCILKTEIL